MGRARSGHARHASCARRSTPAGSAAHCRARAGRAILQKADDRAAGRHGAVHRWAADRDLIFIEFNLEATLGGRPIAWDNIDRFIIGAQGLAIERLNCHDSIALVGKMLSRPRGWAPILRSGLVRRR